MPRQPTGRPVGRPKGSTKLGEHTRLTVRIPTELYARLEVCGWPQLCPWWLSSATRLCP